MDGKNLTRRKAAGGGAEGYLCGWFFVFRELCVIVALDVRRQGAGDARLAGPSPPPAYLTVATFNYCF